MNTILLDHQFINMLESWLWPFFRIGGLVMTAPVIGTRSIPVRIRLLIAIAITLVIAPVISLPSTIDPLSLEGILVSVQQVIIGIAMGFTIRVVFIVLEMSGQLIGQLMGLLLASMVDPTNGNRVPIIGQFYLLLATLLFLSIDGHLIMIKALANSFQKLPVGMHGITRDAVWLFLNWTGTVLSTAVLIALPAVASLLIVNLSFGVMTRASPQLNIFAVGFPVMIMLGMFIIMFTLNGFAPLMINIFEQSFSMLDRITG
ncbi:MAG: flagellar biosynthetic protein FliR [Gammaproteobacteria bacterium]